jgi:hypothetical protein
MTILPPDLEALMPEPAFKLTWRGDLARYFVSKPNIGNTDVFTADQVRAAILGATERAAKVVEHYAASYADIPEPDATRVCENLAAAIRGDRGGA